MMMGNHVTTSTFMTQLPWPCAASWFMHDKTDWWIKYSALVGIDINTV